MARRDPGGAATSAISSGRQSRGGDLAGFELRRAAEMQADAEFLPIAPIGDRIGHRDRGGRDDRQQPGLRLRRRPSRHTPATAPRPDAADPELGAGIGAGRELAGKILGRRRAGGDRAGGGGVAVGSDQLGLPERQAVGRIDGNDIGDPARDKAGAGLFGRWRRRIGPAAGGEQSDDRKTGGRAHDPVALMQTSPRRKSDPARW